MGSQRVGHNWATCTVTFFPFFRASSRALSVTPAPDTQPQAWIGGSPLAVSGGGSTLLPPSHWAHGATGHTCRGMARRPPPLPGGASPSSWGALGGSSALWATFTQNRSQWDRHSVHGGKADHAEGVFPARGRNWEGSGGWERGRGVPSSPAPCPARASPLRTTSTPGLAHKPQWRHESARTQSRGHARSTACLSFSNQ